MDDESWLAAQFEAHRPRLRAIAYRMLGSYSEAVGRPVKVRGAQDVARQALLLSQRARHARLALVNGTVGLAVTARGQLSTVLMFTVVRGKIVEIEILADPDRLRQLEVVTLDRPG